MDIRIKNLREWFGDDKRVLLVITEEDFAQSCKDVVSVFPPEEQEKVRKFIEEHRDEIMDEVEKRLEIFFGECGGWDAITDGIWEYLDERLEKD